MNRGGMGLPDSGPSDPEEARTAVGRFFDARAEGYRRFRRGQYVYCALEDAALRVLSPPPSRLLDVGCGVGTTTTELVRRGYEVFGIDVSEEMIRQARADWGGPGDPPFANAALEDDGLPAASFDQVICLGVIEYVHDPLRFLEALNRVLVPGGWAILQTPNADSWTQRLESLVFTVNQRIGRAQPLEIPRTLLSLRKLRSLAGEHGLQVELSRWFHFSVTPLDRWFPSMMRFLGVRFPESSRAIWAPLFSNSLLCLRKRDDGTS